MIQTMHHCYNVSDEGEGNCDHDYIFIVEPTKDGNLYVQHKNPQIGLQRLGVTVRGLAAETPQFVEEPRKSLLQNRRLLHSLLDAAPETYCSSSASSLHLSMTTNSVAVVG